jgi:hypothetical protein
MTFSLVLFAALAQPTPEPGATAPAPTSQGPISDALARYALLPNTAAPHVLKVVMADGDTVEVQRPVFQAVERLEKVNRVVYVEEQRGKTIRRDGQDVKVPYTVYVPKTQVVEVRRTVLVPSNEVRKETVAAKDCKFFTVTRDGKLEAVEAAKAAGLLKKPAAVLVGTKSEVDPRQPELVKPGTLNLAVPPPKPPAPEKIP